MTEKEFFDTWVEITGEVADTCYPKDEKETGTRRGEFLRDSGIMYSRVLDLLRGKELLEKPVRCVCGYDAESENDLDQHVLASMHLPGDHAQAR